jgi:hypothetical protein
MKTAGTAAQPRGSRWLTLLVSVLAALLILGGVTLWGSAQAIQRGWISGPTFTLKFGTYHILAQTTNRPECVPMPLQECLVTFPIPDQIQTTYTIWMGHMTSERTPVAGGAYTVSRGRLVVALVLE